MLNASLYYNTDGVVIHSALQRRSCRVSNHSRRVFFSVDGILLPLVQHGLPAAYGLRPDAWHRYESK